MDGDWESNNLEETIYKILFTPLKLSDEQLPTGILLLIKRGFLK